MISERGKALKPSPTMAMANRARELQQKGVEVISLTIGEPDWGTYPAIQEAGINAIKQGKTKYTPAHGIPELRQALLTQMNQQLKSNYELPEIVVGSGAKFVIYSALQLLVNPGDEVLIPAPYWVSYPTMVELASGVSKILDCTEKNNFKLTAEQLEKAIGPKTKLLILCSPSNPTGIQYSESELKELAQVIEKKKLFVISDDIYNRLVFGGADVSPHLLHVAPQLRDQVLSVNGASKTYAMTGWRVGWAVGPKKLMTLMADFFSQTTSNLSTVSQWATIEGIKSCDKDLLQARDQLKKKMQMMMAELSKIPLLKPIQPDGAFYIWLDVNATFNKKHKSGSKITNSKDVAETLLDQHGIATVPGSEFGSEGYLRLSIATSTQNLEKALGRFKEFTSSLN